MLMIIIVLASTIFVYFDAKRIGVHKGLVEGFFDLGVYGWTFCTLLLWIIAFPLYLIKRASLKRAVAQEEAARALPATSDTGSTVASSSVINTSAISMLEKLGDLRDRGILSLEEFEQKKKELLGGQ